ncbi:MAG: hypothetical protein ACP5QN_02505 [Minisyncoccia bacterium]
MALPEKIIDELSQSRPETPGWSWRIFIFSLFILLVVVIFYLGLNFGLKPYLNSQIKKNNSELQKLNQSFSEKSKNDLLLFYSQLSNIKNVFDKRTVISPIFSWLEKNTYSEVSFNKFNFNKNSNQLNLGGIAKTKEAALNQVLIFQSKPEIQSVVLNNLTISSQNNWQFDLIVLFKESFLKSNL